MEGAFFQWRREGLCWSVFLSACDDATMLTRHFALQGRRWQHTKPSQVRVVL